MYPILPSEHLVENRTCAKCTTIFPITDMDMEFYEKISPSFGGKKYLIPPPTLCPDCRQQRRLSFRNERKLYKRKCDATNQDIISIYSPDKPYTVYEQKYWWSDKWDPMSYGKDFDFSRGAFEQMEELMREVPRPSLLNANIENSDYVNYSSNLKSAYLCFDASNCEDCLYGNSADKNKDCVDFSELRNSEHCSNMLDSTHCHDVHHGWGCGHSSDSSYVVDLEGAHHCFLSHTIYNKSYIFENEQCTPEEYEKKVKDFYASSSEERQKTIEAWNYRHKNEKIFPYHLSMSFENSYGSGLMNVKNATDCYSVHEAEDIKYCTNSENLKRCYDISSVGAGAEYCYEVNAAIKMYKVCFGFGTWGSDLYCSDHCSFSENLFLCVGLKNASYCILNKQYTKEEYEELVPQIIEKMISLGEWGEFFPATLSPFGYNETVAQEYYPLSREEVVGSSPLRKGDVTEGQGDLVSGREQGKIPPTPFIKGEIFNWNDYEAPFPNVSKVIPASKLPDTIGGIPDDILNWAIECEVSGKPFRIIRQELEFYRKHSLPIPKRHPDIRHLDRMKMRNPRKLFERKCDKCGKDMITTYAPERSERVYCQSCFDREVY